MKAASRSVGRVRHAIDGRLDPPGIHGFQNAVILGEPAGVVGGQGRIEQQFQQQMAEQRRPQSGFAAEGVAQLGGQSQRGFGERAGGVELRIVAEVLQDARRHVRHVRIGIVEERLSVFRSQPHASIGRRQPIRRRRSGDEIRPIEKRQCVGEIVHAACSSASFVKPQAASNYAGISSH